MDEKANLTTQDRVQIGVDLFAKVETGLRGAADGLLELRELFEAGYVAGDIPAGAPAIEAMDECLVLAGMIGDAKQGVMALHVKGTGMAEAAGADIAQPYAELPEREASTRSGGR